MPTLNEPKLGTPKDTGWRYYSLHKTTVLIMREYFNVSKYRESIQLANRQGESLAKLLSDSQSELNSDQKRAMKLARELCGWADEMQEQDYHELYVHAFISMWSSFEAGIENIVADFLQNDPAIAKNVESIFPMNKFQGKNYPKSRDACIWVASMLERKAIKAATNGGKDIAARYVALFSWLGVSFELEDQFSEALAEANVVRNILLHRYGEVGEKDASSFQALKPWVGQVIPIKSEMLQKYNSAINKLLGGIDVGYKRRRK